MFLQQLLNGLTMGSIYALLAVGVSMIYKAMGMMNFAHGDTIMLTRFLTFGISAAFAAVAGILMSPIFYVSTTMATNVATKGFAAAILGGFGSITGGFIGGMILGIVEAIGGAYIATAYKDVISFVVLILVLYFRPNGLFGKRTEQKM